MIASTTKSGDGATSSRNLYIWKDLFVAREWAARQ